jgi:flavin-dependent dehydrogenase
MVQQGGQDYDVVIVGGGPGGTTVGSMLMKYAPKMRVLILEREKFPRAHIGESQLPAISTILNEMGVWDKVEAAGFPIKLGASLTWGRNNESWDFDFYPVEDFKDEPRPAKFEGQRRSTAFQVDRAEYDQILLRHAESLGVEVREETKVAEVMHEGERITGLRLDSGEVVTGRWYIDASGTVALFRKALDIGTDCPVELRNIAIWDYWDNAEWAVKIGVGGTRIQVRSLPNGWLWFIPMGPTRTSLGFVCPAEYYRKTGKTPDEVYYEAVRAEPSIARLVENATASGKVEATKDWSNVSDKIAGPNWFMVGEAAGFADPILSAGMTLAHTSGREAAYVILEWERAGEKAEWARKWYDEKNRQNIRQHIRFAQFWYASNGCFTELQANCQAIAKEAGLKMTPQEAWRWLAQGGFANQVAGTARLGSFDVLATKKLIQMFGDEKSMDLALQKYTWMKMNLVGAVREPFVGSLKDGKIERIECYRRGDKRLPVTGTYVPIIELLKKGRSSHEFLAAVLEALRQQLDVSARDHVLMNLMQAVEVMIADGWIIGKVEEGKGTIDLRSHGGTIRSTAEGMEALRERDEKAKKK